MVEAMMTTGSSTSVLCVCGALATGVFYPEWGRPIYFCADHSPRMTERPIHLCKHGDVCEG